MVTVHLNEDQYKSLFNMLDRELKLGGLSALGVVVDLHNALMAATKNAQEEKQEVSQ